MDATEHPGVPQRPPASAHLLIDSLDRYENSNLGADNTNITLLQALAGADPTAANFTISRNQPLLYGYFTRVAITQVQMEYNVPSVLEQFNNTFLIQYTQGANVNQTVTVTLSSGWYNNVELAAELQTQIRAALAAAGLTNNGFTVTFDRPNYSMTFDTNNADLFGFTGVSAASPVLQTLYLKTLQLIGVTLNQTLAPPALPTVSTIVANRSPRLLYTQYVDIVSRNLTKYQRVKDADTAAVNNKSFIIARVYMVPPNTAAFVDASGNSVGSRPFTICVDYNTPKHIKWSPNEAIHELDFQLLDEYGNELPWDTFYPTEYQLTMLATET